MNISSYLIIGSIFVICIIGVGIFIVLIKSKGIGLEKFYPIVLLIMFIFLIPLLILGKISESTFSTFLGVIIGAFVTAFKELIDKLFKKNKEQNSN